MFWSANAPQSVFNLREGGGSPVVPRSNRKIEAWRAAAAWVWMCWDALLASEPEGRPRAFAAYTAALDAEAAAAAVMAADVAARA